MQPLERRSMLSVSPVGLGPAVAASGPLNVGSVFVDGSGWSPAFRQLVFEGPLGVRVDSPVLYALPWVNIDRVTVTFNYRIQQPRPDHLRIEGVNASSYPAPVSVAVTQNTSQAYATWTLAEPLRADYLVFRVASGPDGVKADFGGQLDGNRDAQVGDDYRLRVNALPGNADNVGSYISQWDVASVRESVGNSIERTGVGNASYTITQDVNGDGRINVTDLAEVRRRLFTRLPRTEPTLSVASTSATTPLRTRPPARDLFSSAPVLE